MSIFAQPTQSMPQETGISSVRVDQVSSISTVNPNGGGTVAFEMTSPANSYFVPRISYWNFRLTVTKGINGDALDETDGQTEQPKSNFFVKFRYNFFSRTKPFTGNSTRLTEVNPFAHALKLSAGYNTWNIYIEYSLSPFFKKGTQTDRGVPLELNSIKVGLIFYVL